MDIVKTNSESSDSEYRWTTSEDSANSNSYNNDKALCIVSYDGGHLYESEVTSQQFHEGVIGDPLNDKGKRILLSSSQSNEYTSYRNAKRFNGGPSINEYKETSKAKPNSGSEADQDDGYIRKSNVIKAKSHPSGNRKNVDDAGNNASVRDQSLVEYDERVVYEEALQNLDGRKYIADLPQGVLTVSLLLHQKVALAWMVQKEKSRHCSGGFLADDQGLGKTISMISLILKQKTLQLEFKSSNSKPTCHEAYNLDDEEEYDHIMTMPASSNWKPAAGTLIVCPATVLRQWARELAEKVNRRHKLSVLIYHGGTRTRDPYQLTKYDVVLTTYALVTNEVPKVPSAFDADVARKKKNEGEVKLEFSDKKSSNMPSVQNKGKKKLKRAKDSSSNSESGPLGRVRWFRVILDEAQTIKNHRTKVARACCGLRAKNRWCLSGTPVQNSIDDLYSYFRFLKYEPYACYSSFCNLIKAPISQDSCSGYTKLQTVLNIVLLRRTKETLIDGMPIVQLPPKKIFLKKVEFSPEERTFYKKLEAESRQLFKRYAAAGTVKKNYASILLMLLRMRQACNHPILVKGYHSENVGKGSLEIAKQLPEERLLELIHQLEGSLAICILCNDPPENAVVTICGHVFCYQCVSERLTGDDNMCPASGCKETLNTDVTFSRSTLQKCITDQNDNDKASSSASTNNEDPSIFQSGYVSSKIKAALGILNTLCSPDYVVGSKEWNEWDHTIPIKAIVFSQWNGMLDLVEDSLNQNLIQYRRLDGSMSLASRDKAVVEFNSDPEVTVMLMSLKAGNLGLNMVAASHVILLDLWWNPATEDQAIDRAHRIGQTRPVNVSRLTIKDTIEDRILSLQDEKRSLVSSAIGEDIGNHARKLTMEDLKYLFMI